MDTRAEALEEPVQRLPPPGRDEDRVLPIVLEKFRIQCSGDTAETGPKNLPKGSFFKFLSTHRDPQDTCKPVDHSGPMRSSSSECMHDQLKCALLTKILGSNHSVEKNAFGSGSKMP